MVVSKDASHRGVLRAVAKVLDVNLHGLGEQVRGEQIVEGLGDESHLPLGNVVRNQHKHLNKSTDVELEAVHIPLERWVSEPLQRVVVLHKRFKCHVLLSHCRILALGLFRRKTRSLRVTNCCDLAEQARKLRGPDHHSLVIVPDGLGDLALA